MVGLARSTSEGTMEEACFPTLCSALVSQQRVRWRTISRMNDPISEDLWEDLYAGWDVVDHDLGFLALLLEAGGVGEE